MILHLHLSRHSGESLSIPEEKEKEKKTGQHRYCPLRGKWKKQADRPDSVTVHTYYDSHSSRRRIAPALKLPTRTLRGPHQCVPIWNCTRWRLPRFTVTQYARLCGPVPRLIPFGFRRTAVNRHPVLWCPDLPPVPGMNRKPATVWLASSHCILQASA